MDSDYCHCFLSAGCTNKYPEKTTWGDVDIETVLRFHATGWSRRARLAV